jgi:DNA-directed RNA polymerase specialized sigma24 family protein
MPQNDAPSETKPKKKGSSAAVTVVAIIGAAFAGVGGWQVAKTAHHELSHFGSAEFSECVDDLSQPGEQGDPFDYAILGVQRVYGFQPLEAREIVYDTLVAVCVMSAKKEIENLESYFMGSLNHEASRRAKQKARWVSWKENLDSSRDPAPPSDSDEGLDVDPQVIESCLKELSLFEQELIRFRIYQDLTWEQISARIGRKMSARTAKRQFDAAMEKFGNICRRQISGGGDSRAIPPQNGY